MQKWGRRVVAVEDAGACCLGRGRAMAGLVAYDGAVGPLGEGFLPDCLKEGAIHDRRLLARQDLILVFDLTDIEMIAQHVVQRAAAERDAAAGDTGGEQSAFGSDVTLFEVT